MNIFNQFENHINEIYDKLVASGQLEAGHDLSKMTVELPRDEAHGDLATNVAMVTAKSAKMNPRELAALYAAELEALDEVNAVEIAGPGFLNLRLPHGVWQAQLRDIYQKSSDYGRSDMGKGQHVNVEFVSANPTGPLHAAHARGAIFGDALSHLLEFAGYKVTREYYINDAGRSRLS